VMMQTPLQDPIVTTDTSAVKYMRKAAVGDKARLGTTKASPRKPPSRELTGRGRDGRLRWFVESSRVLVVHGTIPTPSFAVKTHQKSVKREVPNRPAKEARRPPFEALRKERPFMTQWLPSPIQFLILGMFESGGPSDSATMMTPQLNMVQAFSTVPASAPSRMQTRLISLKPVWAYAPR
jgi:hypothetical protein